MLIHSRQDLRRYAEYHCVINDVEDAVQESLITVSRKLGDLRSLECFASWLFRIVKRECNRLKRRQRMLSGDVISDDILPVVMPEPAEWRHDVALALESLPAHYREVVLLRDLEGLTIAEMAQRLDTHPGSGKVAPAPGAGFGARVPGSMRFRTGPTWSGPSPCGPSPLPPQLEL